MARVDPFIHPIPQTLLKDKETRAFFEYLIVWCHNMWKRTGGGADTIEDTEASIVSQDGGNRTQRYLQDEIANIWGHISEYRPTTNRDELDNLQDQISDLKKQNRRLLQFVDALDLDMLQMQATELRRQNRNLSNLVNELTERVDSGT